MDMLETTRILLRPYEMDDLDDILKYFNDSEVRQFLCPGIPYPFSREEEKTWLQNLPKQTDQKTFAITRKEDGSYMGGCGINEMEWTHRWCVVGIFLGKPFWNQGYGTEALGALIEFMFTQMNLNKACLRVYGFNKRAMQSYLKLGFQVEGTLRQQIYRNGEYHDEYVMGLLRSEWNRPDYIVNIPL